MKKTLKKVHVNYYAILREQRGQDDETVQTLAETAHELYSELCEEHGFTLGHEQLRVVVNAQIQDWHCAVRANDTVVFLPPVAGG